MRALQHRVGKTRLKNAGFSLIEVILAISIIVFAFVPMMGLLSIGFSGYRSASELSIEAVIVQNFRSSSARITTVGQDLSDAYFDIDGTLTASTSESAIYKVTAEPATNASIAGTNSPTLLTRFAIVHIPSGQTRSAGVVHITPR